MLIWVKQKKFIDGVLQFQTGQKLSLKLTYAYHTQEKSVFHSIQSRYIEARCGFNLSCNNDHHEVFSRNDIDVTAI